MTLEDLPAFGFALGLIILLMIGGPILAQLLRRAQRRTSSATMLPAPASSVRANPAPRELPRIAPVDEWLPLLFERAAHILILGGSGSGKTRTARGLVRFIVEQRNERVIILDPKANRDTWMGLPAIVPTDDIDDVLEQLLAEFQQRLDQNPQLTERQAEQTFERIWIIIDEVSFVRDNCPRWLPFLRRISSMARSLKLHLIIVNQSERVEELGLRGRGDLLANFARINLSLAVWQGAPAGIDIGAFSVAGAWLNYFPQAYRGRPLPHNAIHALGSGGGTICSREPVPAAEPAWTGAEPMEPRFPSASGTATNWEPPVPVVAGERATHGEQNPSSSAGERERILWLAAQGWSRNRIAAEIGGRRGETLARIRDILEPPQ